VICDVEVIWWRENCINRRSYFVGSHTNHLYCSRTWTAGMPHRRSSKYLTI